MEFKKVDLKYSDYYQVFQRGIQLGEIILDKDSEDVHAEWMYSPLDDSPALTIPELEELVTFMKTL